MVVVHEYQYYRNEIKIEEIPTAQWAKHGGQVDIGLKLNKIIII